MLGLGPGVVIDTIISTRAQLGKSRGSGTKFRTGFDLIRATTACTCYQCMVDPAKRPPSCQAAMGKELEQRSADAGRGPGGTAGDLAARGGDPAIAAFIGAGRSSLAGSTPAGPPSQEPSSPAQDADSGTAPGSQADQPASPATTEEAAVVHGTGESCLRPKGCSQSRPWLPAAACLLLPATARCWSF